ncbi:MAG: hypothetical protein Q8M22_19255 [Actinomycetota bacterium]|nr:hypothetical protein [Actinomycetota bacterium]
MRTLPILICCVASLAACSDDDPQSAPPDTVVVASDAADAPAPTVCATGEFDAGRTVVVRHNDLVGGIGSLGTRTPNELQAGLVRIAVEADDENGGLANVSVTLDGALIAEITGVEPGATCAVDVELVAGTYAVTDGLQDASFEVVAP